MAEQQHSETQNKEAGARILPGAERKERLLDWAPSFKEKAEKRYLNGHAGTPAPHSDDQQEAPILIILLWLQLEHRHLAGGSGTGPRTLQAHRALGLITEGSRAKNHISGSRTGHIPLARLLSQAHP